MKNPTKPRMPKALSIAALKDEEQMVLAGFLIEFYKFILQEKI